mmetsp:Transcript_29912/g.75288  ORF Transcript_29912/g.75288 Transcript_29912/m.75288 type:complete len:636 (-) Transcript_29912:785-2692(-)
MADLWDQEKSEFFVFEESGNYNQNELLQLTTSIINNPNIPRDTNADFGGVKIIGCLRPAKNKKTGLIDHILFFSYNKYTEEKINIVHDFVPEPSESQESDTNHSYEWDVIKKDYYFPEFNRWMFDSNVRFFSNGDDSDFLFGGPLKLSSKDIAMVFEVKSGEEYSSSLLEKSYYYTGLFFSSNIIINVSKEDLMFVKNNSRFDTIFKIFAVYIEGLIAKTITDQNKKFFWIVVRDDDVVDSTFVRRLYKLFIEEMVAEIGKHFDIPRIFEFRVFNDFEDEKYSKQAKKLLYDCVRDEFVKESWLDLAFSEIEKESKNEAEYKEPDAQILFDPKKSNFLLNNFDRFVEENLKSYKNLVSSEIEPIEIISETACSKVAAVALELVKNVMRPWYKLINSGWVQGLGEELNQLLKKIEEFYEKEAGIFKHTKAYQRKLEQLIECFFMESRVMFQPQMNHLKENLKQYFKSACSNIGLTESIERDLNQLINLFDEEFINQAKSSIPKLAKKTWSFNYERENLKKYMIELVDEKMKMTYYKGLLVKKVKTPISIWFHALFPHPFGKDLSNEPFTTEDTFSYDTREVRRRGKASLMRHVLARKVEWETPQKDSPALQGEVSQEDFVFKENPKKAIKRLEKNR